MGTVAETGRTEDGFWREYPSMIDYFSPGIVPILKYFGLNSREVMRDFGIQVGRSAASRMADLSIKEMLDKLAGVWQEFRIGSLSIESRNPLVLQISNCTVCGQLQGTGDMFECSFHEGFFQGALSLISGKVVNLRQETNYEGEAGTWCRRLVSDISV
jgi:predicted hydrocarbon binding protein